MTRPRRGHRWRWVALAILLPLAVAWLGWQQTQAPGFNASHLVLIDGRKLNGNDLTDGPVLLNFWATTCPVCIAEMPDLAQLHQDFRDRGFSVLAVAMPYDPPDQVVDFTRRHALPFPVSLDLDSELTLSFGLSRITPVNILLDRQGVERWRHVGRLPTAEARLRIKQLLEEG